MNSQRKGRQRSLFSVFITALVGTMLMLSSAGTSAAAVAKKDPPGNNGTVKIDGKEFDTHPNNQPHVGCEFQVDFYGFDAGVGNATVTFELQSPTVTGRTLTVTSGQGNPSSVPIGEDAAGGGTDFDAEETYVLAFTGAPHPQQGYHVKLTVNAPGSQGSDTKHKVFWVEGCVPPNPPVAIPVQNTNDPCNGPGVTDNVVWAAPLPADTAEIDWSESSNGATRTATLKVDRKWTDGTTAPKVYTLPADSGVKCPEDETFVPTKPSKLDKCEPQKGTNDRVFIPEDANFTYTLNGVAVTPGPQKATKMRYVVKAIPNSGVLVTEGAKTRWVFEFSKKACFVPEDVQGAVKKVDKCRTGGDQFAVKPHRGIVYYADGKRVRENVWLKTHGDRKIVVKAKPASDRFNLVGKTRWVLRFDNRPCGTPDVPPDTGARPQA